MKTFLLILLVSLGVQAQEVETLESLLRIPAVASGGGGSPAFVQYAYGGGFAYLSQPFSNNVTSGSTLVAIIQHGNSDSTSGYTASDTLGNSWSRICGTNTTEVGVAVFVTKTSSGGADTVSISGAGGTGIFIALMEYSGLSTGSVDGFSMNAIPNSAGFNSVLDPGSFNTSTTGVVVGFAADPNGNGRSVVTNSPYSFFLLRDYSACQHDIGSSAGSYDPSITVIGTVQGYVAIGFGLK